MEDTFEAVTQALSILQQASAVDMAGDSDIALLLYTSAAARLELLSQYLPAEHKEAVQKHIEGIKHRGDTLRTERSRKGVAAFDFPKFPVQFSPQPPPVEDEIFTIPQATVMRPFWLMRVLSRSMQEGAFVTPDLFVSKHMWYQDGAMTVVTYIAPKVKYLSGLCEAMEPLQQLNTLNDSKRLIRALDDFLRLADELKSAFDTDVGKIKSTDTIAQRSKLERGVWELLHKGQSVLKSWKLQQDATYNACIAWAVNVLEQAQLFDRWTTYFTGSTDVAGLNDVLERLHRISAYFYFGPCNFLLQDMMLLVERYTEKSRESFSRLLPADLRIESKTTHQ